MNKAQIENMIHDYMWMMTMIIESRAELRHIRGGNLVSVITDMPTGSGGNSDIVANEAIRRATTSKTIDRLEKKIELVQKHSKCITDDKEVLVLNYILDGYTIQSISEIMKISRTTIYKIRDSIVDKMYASLQSEQKNIKNVNF